MQHEGPFATQSPTAIPFGPLYCPAVPPQVSAVHVVRVLQGQEGSLDAEDAQRVLDSYLSVRPNGWSNVASE